MRASTSATPAGAAGASSRRARFRRRLPTTERALLIRQLASLVTAGLPLAQALAVVQDQAERPRVRDLLAAIRGDVVSGMTLASAFARHPRDIPELDRALIAAGEQSGDLGTVLMRLADHIERRNALKAKVTAAFVYPAIVTTVAVLVVTALLVYVVPQIVGVFAQTQAEAAVPDARADRHCRTSSAPGGGSSRSSRSSSRSRRAACWSGPGRSARGSDDC